MRESAISSQNPIQEIVDDGLISLGMDNVESFAYLPDQIQINVIHLKSQRTYTGGGALQGSALLDHALGSRRTPEHALRYMHYKTTHKPL